MLHVPTVFSGQSLATVYFVDYATTVNPGQQNGSLYRPYDSVQDAINAIPTPASDAEAAAWWTIYVARGTGTGEALTIPGNRGILIEVLGPVPSFAANTIDYGAPAFTTISWDASQNTSASRAVTLYLKGVYFTTLAIDSSPAPAGVCELLLESCKGTSITDGGTGFASAIQLMDSVVPTITAASGVALLFRSVVGSGCTCPSLFSESSSVVWTAASYTLAQMASTTVTMTGNAMPASGGYMDEPTRLMSFVDAASPAQITGDQNDYLAAANYLQFQGCRFLRLSTDASHNITGLVALAAFDGCPREKVVVNVGAQDIVLVHASGLSAAANQFLCSTGANITLTANQSARIYYDSTSARWRVWKVA